MNSLGYQTDAYLGLWPIQTICGPSYAVVLTEVYSGSRGCNNILFSPMESDIVMWEGDNNPLKQKYGIGPEYKIQFWCAGNGISDYQAEILLEFLRRIKDLRDRAFIKEKLNFFDKYMVNNKVAWAKDICLASCSTNKITPAPRQYQSLSYMI